MRRIESRITLTSASNSRALGLGMRESSGQYCCGRDTSEDNTTADTAEAGLFQMSWNAMSRAR